MSLSGRIVYFFLSFVVLEEATSMKTRVPYGDNVLSANENEDFYKDLQVAHNNDSYCLERASQLLGARGAKEKGGADDYAIARKIDVLIGGCGWQDENDVTNDIISMKDPSLANIVQSFIKDQSESSNMVQYEIERAFVHLWKHVLDNKHILLSIENKQVGKSFFFMLLSSPPTEQSRSEFLNALRSLLSTNFSGGSLSPQTDNICRSCVQVKYEISCLFAQPFCVSGIPIYSLDNFQFIPISDGYVAKNIVLRFTIQKLGNIKRLYLMTLFPAERDTHFFVSDDKLRALSILNGVNPVNLFKPQPLPLRQSESIFIVDIPPPSSPTVLRQSPIDYFYVDAPAPRNLATTDSTVIFEKSGENNWRCLLL